MPLIITQTIHQLFLSIITYVNVGLYNIQTVLYSPFVLKEGFWLLPHYLYRLVILSCTNSYLFFDYCLTFIIVQKIQDSYLTSLNFQNNFILFSLFNYNYFNDFVMTQHIEPFSSKRNLRFNLPIFKFDFKSGVYITDRALISSYHLLNTTSHIINAGQTKPQWFFSDTFFEGFSNSFNNINANIIIALTAVNVKTNLFNQFTYSLPTKFLSHFDIFFFF